MYTIQFNTFNMQTTESEESDKHHTLFYELSHLFTVKSNNLTKPRLSRWDETPRADISETPGHASGWLETPRTDRGGDDGSF